MSFNEEQIDFFNKFLVRIYKHDMGKERFDWVDGREMSFEERLGLPAPTSNKNTNTKSNTNTTSSSTKVKKKKDKEMKRAYYRASLQWHPDRWAGMNIYLLPVTSIFELISEAYTQLSNHQVE